MLPACNAIKRSVPTEQSDSSIDTRDILTKTVTQFQARDEPIYKASNKSVPKCSTLSRTNASGSRTASTAAVLNLRGSAFQTKHSAVIATGLTDDKPETAEVGYTGVISMASSIRLSGPIVPSRFALEILSFILARSVAAE